MTAIETAKAALRAHVTAHVPEAHRAELSRLTAAFVAAVVREERATASAQQRTAAKLAYDTGTMMGVFSGFGARRP